MRGASLRLGMRPESLRPGLHNGPGWRVSVWLQGCKLRCTRRCLNPHLLPAEGGWALPVSELTDRLERVIGGFGYPVEGISVLGGEPSEQPEGLAALLRWVRGRGLSTMVYTGYTCEALRGRGDPATDRWLEATDLLVDGPFLEARYSDTLPWRGSDNQRLLCLSDRYTPEALEAAFARQGKGFSIRVSADGSVSASGFQDREGATLIAQLLSRR